MERVQREVSGRSRVQRSISLAIAGGVTISQGSRSKRPASLGHGSGWNRSKRLGVVGISERDRRVWVASDSIG